MTYKMIVNIFDLMEETIKALNDISELRISLKNQGKLAETERLLEAETRMTSVLFTYSNLIECYVKSADALIDDFDDDFEEYLENNIYDLDDYYEYGYSNEAINEIKAEVRRSFFNTIWSSVVEDNFYNNDKGIQAFINGFNKIDLYLYILSK